MVICRVTFKTRFSSLVISVIMPTKGVVKRSRRNCSSKNFSSDRTGRSAIIREGSYKHLVAISVVTDSLKQFSSMLSLHRTFAMYAIATPFNIVIVLDLSLTSALKQFFLEIASLVAVHSLLITNKLIGSVVALSSRTLRLTADSILRQSTAQIVDL